MFVVDAEKVIAELCPGDTPPAVSSAIMRRARSLGEELKTGGTDHYELMRTLIARVDDAICVALKRASLFDQLDIPFNENTPAVGAPLELKMPAELRRPGEEKRLIVAAHAPKTKFRWGVDKGDCPSASMVRGTVWRIAG